MNLLADPLAKAFNDCKASGVLPPDATLPLENDQPWPVTLLTALGAWLAALPLFGLLFLGLGDILVNGWGPYLFGGIALIGAVIGLRARVVSIFIEQLAAVALFLGFVLLSYGLPRDISSPVAAACLAVLALGLAIAVPQAWLRVLLGAATAGFGLVATVPMRFFSLSELPAFQIWLSLQAALLLWLVGLAVQQSQLVLQSGVRLAATLESISTGWLLVVLGGLCWWSGQ